MKTYERNVTESVMCNAILESIEEIENGAELKPVREVFARIKTKNTIYNGIGESMKEVKNGGKPRPADEIFAELNKEHIRR